MGETFISPNTMDYLKRLDTLVKYVDGLGYLMITVLVIMMCILFFKKTNHSHEIKMAKFAIDTDLKDIKNELKKINENIKKLIDK